MESHLKKLGWPNVENPDELVLDQAESMFKLLLKADLVKYTDWDDYYTAAVVQYERAKIRKWTGL